MDEDTDQLIALLCNRVGMLMEDASVLALSVGHIEPGRRAARINELQDATATMVRLVVAAQALLR